jgi:hypothetical protein
VIAAKDEWDRARPEHRQHLPVQRIADSSDLLDVLLPRIALRPDLRNRRHQIAVVHDASAEGGQPFSEPGDPECGRSHIDAAAVAAEVERHADDVDGTHRLAL